MKDCKECLECENKRLKQRVSDLEQELRCKYPYPYVPSIPNDWYQWNREPWAPNYVTQDQDDTTTRRLTYYTVTC